MISVNLCGQNDVSVTATVYPKGEHHGAFIGFDVGPLSVILASVAHARTLASELNRAADRWEGLPPEQKIENPLDAAKAEAGAL